MPVVRSSLLAAAALSMLWVGGAASQPSGPTVLNIELSDYKFQPRVIELNQGQAYRLHLTNPSAKLHGLTAKSFFDAVSLAEWSASRVRKGGIEVWPGQSVDVDLTPRTTGDYEMHSPYPMNEMLGMKGRIIVHGGS